MDFKEMTTLIDGLNNKALAAHDPNEAMKFSQAAVNVANSYATLKSIQRGC